MHTVEDLENTLKDIFITTESTYNQQVELENLLEEVDPRSLIRTIWENSETIYSFRTEKNREQCMEYCESELFKKWVTLLYSENCSGSPIDAQTINLWLLHDAGFLVTADFYLALDGNEYDSPVGWKGERTRLFLTEAGYQKSLESQEKGHIEILSHAKVRQGHLYYDRSDQLR